MGNDELMPIDEGADGLRSLGKVDKLLEALRLLENLSFSQRHCTRLYMVPLAVVAWRRRLLRSVAGGQRLNRSLAKSASLTGRDGPSSKAVPAIRAAATSVGNSLAPLIKLRSCW